MLASGDLGNVDVQGVGDRHRFTRTRGCAAHCFAEHLYTILTAGEESSASLGTILLTDDHVAPAPGQLRLRFVNAASDIGSIDLYFASANSGFPTTPSVPALAFKSSTTYILFSGTSVQLCANPAGGPQPPRGPWRSHRFLPDVSYLAFSIATTKQHDLSISGCPIPPANSPPGSFTAPMVLKSIPF